MFVFFTYLTSQVEECVRRAKAAQLKWRETSFDERRAFLHDLMDVIVVNQDEIARASSMDTGKTSMSVFAY